MGKPLYVMTLTLSSNILVCLHFSDTLRINVFDILIKKFLKKGFYVNLLFKNHHSCSDLKANCKHSDFSSSAWTLISKHALLFRSIFVSSTPTEPACAELRYSSNIWSTSDYIRFVIQSCPPPILIANNR